MVSAHRDILMLTETKMTNFAEEDALSNIIVFGLAVNDCEWRRLSPTFENSTLALLHDISQGCGKAQHCILVWCLVDTFVYAHNHHRHSRNDPDASPDDCSYSCVRSCVPKRG